jgi:hypothetical protein
MDGAPVPAPGSIDRVEGLRFGPELRVAVGAEGEQHHQPASRDFKAVDDVDLHGIASVDRGRRVETEGLLDHLQSLGHLPETVDRRDPVSQHAAQLGVKTGIRLRAGRQCIPGNSHRPCGRLVASEEQRH